MLRSGDSLLLFAHENPERLPLPGVLDRYRCKELAPATTRVPREHGSRDGALVMPMGLVASLAAV